VASFLQACVMATTPRTLRVITDTMISWLPQLLRRKVTDNVSSRCTAMSDDKLNRSLCTSRINYLAMPSNHDDPKINCCIGEEQQLSQLNCSLQESRMNSNLNIQIEKQEGIPHFAIPKISKHAAPLAAFLIETAPPRLRQRGQ
jgi:hypothetical protein